MANICVMIKDMSMNGLNNCQAIWTATDGLSTFSGITEYVMSTESSNVTNKRIEDDAKAKWIAARGGTVEAIHTWFGRSP